jgi:hypothetical protein
VTAKNQTGSRKDVSHAQTLEQDTNSQKEDKESEDVTPAEGEIIRISNVPTEFGRWSTIKETVTATDQEGGELGETFFVASERESHTQDTAANVATEEAALEKFVDGTISSYRKVPTEFGLFATVKDVAVSKEQEWDYVATLKDKEESTKYHGRNVEMQPTITAEAGKNITLHAVRNDFGRWDYEKIVETPKVPESCQDEVTWPDYGGRYSYVVSSFDTEHKQWYAHYEYFMQEVRIHHLKYFTDAASAAEALTAAAPIYGASVQPAGDYLWMAKWHTRDDITWTVKTLPNPWSA